MFGGKITGHSVSRALGNLKHHIGQTYHRTKHFLGQVDYGIHVAKKVYGVLAPVLDQYGGGNANKHIMKAIGGYEHLRNKVMDTHETTANNVHQVVGHLKKRVPELGL
jgi:metal-dependent HD superfamily phosphatase/phosphodiesterase